MATKQLTLGVPRISADNDSRYNWEALSAILEAMGHPAPASDRHGPGAGVSFFPGPTIDFKLSEVLKDNDGDGVYTAVAKVLDTDGTQTTTSPTTVTVRDRGGRYTSAKVDDVGKAQQRLVDGEVCWEITDLRETKRLQVYAATDSTGGTAISGTAAKVTFDNEVVNSGGLWTLASSTVEVNAAGTVDIEGDVTIDCTSLTSGNPSVALYVDVGGSEQTGSRRFFPPITVTGKMSCSYHWTHSASAGDQISVKVLWTNAPTASISTVADQSYIRLTILDSDETTVTTNDSNLGPVFEWESNTDTTNTGLTDGSPAAYSVGALSGTGHPSNGGSNAALMTTSTYGVYAGSSFAWNLDDMTILFWLNLNQAGDTTAIFYKASKANNGDPEWVLSTANTRKLNLAHTTFNSSDAEIETATVEHATTITNGTWLMVGLHWQKFVATGDRWRIGISQDGGAITWSDLADATAPSLTGNEVAQQSAGCEFHINDDFFGPYATVELDMYRQWFRELSTTEISNHYNGGAGLAWPF